jgi:hypothetical protein
MGSKALAGYVAKVDANRSHLSAISGED